MYSQIFVSLFLSASGLRLSYDQEDYKNGADLKSKTKVLHMSMSHPSDPMPVDVILMHQRRGLGDDENDNVINTMLLDNTPPWLSDEEKTSKNSGLTRLYNSPSELISVQGIDWSVLHDNKNVDSVFALPLEHLKRHDNLVSKCWPRGSVTSSSPNSDRIKLSNWGGMLTFMNRCRNADVDLCAWFDSDIIVHRNTSSLIGLAKSVFRDNPTALILNPPNPCEHNMADAEGTCGVQRTHFTSGRYMIINRTRLTAALPLSLPNGFNGCNLFETVLSSSKYDQMKMNCGMEAFTVHPPNRFNSGNATKWLQTLAEEAIKRDGNLSHKPLDQIGAKELFKRVDAERFVWGHDAIKRTRCGCSNLCEDV